MIDTTKPSKRRLVMHGSERLAQAEARYLIALIDADSVGDSDYPRFFKVGRPLRQRLNDLLLRAQSPSPVAHYANKMREAEKASRPKRRRPPPPQPIKFPSGGAK